MERREPKANTDELTVVQAAAWAWYHHGPGSEGRPMREFDLLRTWRAPGPSRYKLEAMRMAEDNTTEGSSRSPSICLSPSQTDNSLLDSYEVGRISKHLEFLIESSSGNYYCESLAHNQGHRKDGSSPDRRKKKSMRWNGLFLLRHAWVCASRGDVVEGRMLGLGGRRLPQYGSVVGLAKCRSPAKDAE